MHHLSIDLETYSSVPLAKAGAQKYIQSPDFEILLFAFSLDGAQYQKWCRKHGYNFSEDKALDIYLYGYSGP